jgi:hypothetical protein
MIFYTENIAYSIVFLYSILSDILKLYFILKTWVAEIIKQEDQDGSTR